MPTYDYYCEKCELKFDKSRMKIEDRVTDCPKCGTESERQVSIPNIGRSGTSRTTTDILIGKEADTRWKGIHARKSEKDKIRKESGSHAVSTQLGKDESGKINYAYKSVTKERLEERKAIYSKYKKLEDKK